MALDAFYPSGMDEAAGQANKGLKSYGYNASLAGYHNLLQLLLGQGRVDPRLLASAQAQNARATQQQQDASRATSTRSGFGNSGLSQAMQAAIGAAGSNRATNLNYQDIADSYARNQENLGLMNQLVVQPGLANRQMGLDYSKQRQDLQLKKANAITGSIGSIFSSLGGAMGGG